MSNGATTKEKLSRAETAKVRSLPKYRDLAHRLRSQIVKGQLQPGDRLPSFPQMHREWGVTQKTAEQAYALLEKEGLILRRTGSGVYVNDKKQPVATGVIAVANGFPAQHPYFLRLLNGVQDAARARQIEVLLLHENSLIRWEKVDGVLSCDPCPEQVLERLPHGLPHVSLLHPLAGSNSVVADDRRALRSSVKFLADLGHRRIGYVTASHLYSEEVGCRRVAGYHDGLADAGIAPDPKWFRPRVRPAKAEYDNRKFGYQEMAQWLREDWDESGCTALFAHNDEAALGVLDALQERGISVPGEVSVIGFDGLALTHPSCGAITSISVPLYDIGARGAELLIDITRQPLAGAKEGVVLDELPAHLEPADSTAEAKSGKAKAGH